MRNLIYINVKSFLYEDKVYTWNNVSRLFMTLEYWDKVHLESFRYELKQVPVGATILRYSLVRGGSL